MPAQDYPARPIKLVVPIGAGGGTDILARHMAQKMGERVKQGVVVVESAPAVHQEMLAGRVDLMMDNRRRLSTTCRRGA